MSNNLGKKIALGAAWTVLMRITMKLLGIVSLVILARLLTPEDFGIVAKATLIYGFLETIFGFGFQSALIKNQSASTSEYNTVWTLSLCRGLVIGLILIAISPLLATFFREPALTPIIICYGLISIFKGLTNVGIVDFLKYMEFHLDFRFILIKKLSGFFVTLTIAYIYESYWALIFGSLTSNIVALVLSYLMCSYRPKLETSKWRDLFHFSKWIFGYDLCAALSSKLDLFILGRYSSSNILGLYTVSYEIAGTPSNEISMPIARAALPGLSKINRDSDKFQHMYLSILGMIIFIALPLSVGLSVTANLIVSVFLGEKWSEAGVMISILAIVGFFRAINAVGVSAYISFDRPDLLTKVTSFSLLLRVIGIPIGMYFWGVIGLCWSIAITAGITAGVHLIIQQKIGMLHLSPLGGSLLRTLVSTAVMYFVVHFLPIKTITNEPQALALLIFSGAASFVLSLLLMRKTLSLPAGPDCIAITVIMDKIKRGGSHG